MDWLTAGLRDEKLFGCFRKVQRGGNVVKDFIQLIIYIYHY